MEKPSLNYGDLPKRCSLCQGLIKHKCWRFEMYIDNPERTGCEKFKAALAPGMKHATVERLGWSALYAICSIILIAQSLKAADGQLRVIFTLGAAFFAFFCGLTLAHKTNLERGN